VRYFFRVEYDGSAYHGWQRQPNGCSVQESLERAFCIVVRETCAITGGGRTDTGVHAARQGAHVDIAAPLDTARCQRSVNAVLPGDIAIFDLQPVDPSFHARYTAVERRYRYTIVRRKSPLRARQAWYMTCPVDWGLVSTNLTFLVGTHDFATFCASGSAVEHTLCTMHRATFEQQGDQGVFFFAANRFLYRMVRSLVGTLVDIGRGARAGSMAAILASRDRGRAGPSAPAVGLVLEDVIYPGLDK
jgi:tRNA pseudouridine38-40 synthase